MVLSQEPVTQVIGKYSFNDFWKRHIRWGRIRKAQAPLAFMVEIFSYPALLSVSGAEILGPYLGVPKVDLLWALSFVFFYLDVAVMMSLGASVSPRSLFAWWVREALAPIQWVCVLMGNQVDWRGNLIKVEQGGLITVRNSTS